MEKDHPTTIKDFFKRRLIICGIVLLIGVVLFLSAMQITSAMIFGDEAMSTYISYTLSQDTQDITRETLGQYFSDSLVNSGKLDEQKTIYDPVSYTHLDVYKRQSYYMAGHHR